MRGCCLHVLCSALCAAVVASATAQGGRTRAVLVSEDKGLVRVSNGLVEARFEVAKARLTSLRLRGEELLGRRGRAYFQMVAQGVFGTPENASLRVSKRGKRHVDLAFRFAAPGGAFEVELHWLLRSGLPGLYAYAVVRRAAASGPRTELEQMNWAVRVDPQSFDVAHVGADRRVALPAPSALAAGQVLRPTESVRLASGRVFDKYMLSAMHETHSLHGLTGPRHGIWVVQPSRADIGGGPTNQELTVHASTTTPVLLRMAHAGHYGSGKIAFDAQDEGWKKLYGPWLLYANAASRGASSAAGRARIRARLWRDAQKRSVQEAKQWPYTWLDHELYPQRRGRVSGRLVDADGGVADACLVLAKLGDERTPHWQRQGKGYQFWTRSSKSGSFRVSHVRAGRYALYAFADGRLGEFRKDIVEVKAGSSTNLGVLDWPAASGSRVLWQLGSADRSAGEFAGAGDFRDFGTWSDQARRFPRGIRFVIGRSDPAKDWYYQHANERDAGGVWRPTKRTIVFDVGEAVTGRAALTVAIASARSTGLRLTLNGQALASWPKLLSCGANCRYGLRGYYREKRAIFDASLLRAGQNELVFENTGRGEFRGLLYDCVRLELLR